MACVANPFAGEERKCAPPRAIDIEQKEPADPFEGTCGAPHEAHNTNGTF